jgi:hypothetical protein
MFREKLRKVKRLSKKLISLMEAIMKQLALIIQIEHLNNLRRSFLRLKIKDRG